MSCIFRPIKNLINSLQLNERGIDLSRLDFDELLVEEARHISTYLNKKEDVAISLKAIALYRIAYSLTKSTEANKTLARQITEYTKVCTGIEINPDAKISQQVVFIPGGNTVVGETSIIGEESVIDAGVILGSMNVGGERAQASPIRRHPIIGSRCRVGRFAQIFGPIAIENNTYIDPYQVITFKETLKRETEGV